MQNIHKSIVVRFCVLFSFLRATRSASKSGVKRICKGPMKNRVKKKPERKIPENLIIEALNSIEAGTYSYREAAEHYDIPKSTIWTKYHSKVPLTKRKGPASILTVEEENRIVEWLMYSGKKGFPISKSQLLDHIQKFVVEIQK